MQGECKKASLLVFCRAAAIFMQKVWNYPGTPPPSVYQVTHGTAFQAAERYVRHMSCTYSIRGLLHHLGKTVYFLFIALRWMQDPGGSDGVAD